MLNTDSLYKAMVRSFGTVTSNAAFGEDFVQALNNSFDELSFSGELATAIAHVTSPTANVSELSGDDSYIVSAGLVVHLIGMGWPHRSDDPTFFQRVAFPMWEEAKGAFMVKKSREDQATVDDDDVPTADILGLGYTGDE